MDYKSEAYMNSSSISLLWSKQLALSLTVVLALLLTACGGGGGGSGGGGGHRL